MIDIENKVITILNKSIDEFTNLRPSHAKNCKCYLCSNVFPNDFFIERIGYYEMSEEIFLNLNPDLIIIELAKQMRFFIKKYVFKPYNLHYRVKKTLYGIRYDFFRINYS